MKELETLISVFTEANNLKEIARKSKENFQSYLPASEEFHKAAQLSEKLALNLSLPNDTRIACLVNSQYYRYEEEDCISSYYYEMRDTEEAKKHHKARDEFLKKTLELLKENIESVSVELKTTFENQIDLYSFFQFLNKARTWAIDARNCWDSGDILGAIDLYRKIVDQYKTSLTFLAEHKSIPPAYERITKGNILGFLANAASASARIIIGECDGPEMSFPKQISHNLSVRLLKYLLEAIQISNAAYEENPQWKEYRQLPDIYQDQIKSFLRNNKIGWPDYYLEFMDDQTFIKLMKMVDLAKFKEVEGTVLINENKVIRIWAAGGFFIMSFVIIAAVIYLFLKSGIGWWKTAILIMIAQAMSIIIGAFTMRSVDSLSEKNFMELISMALQYQFKFLKHLRKREK